MWLFALGLVLWTALLLWAWVQIGRSLGGTVQRKDESRDTPTPGEKPKRPIR